MTRPIHILVTNDDGVTALGLLALVQKMRKLGQVSVLAPDRNWSGGGHVKTLDRALRVKETRLSDGTPAFASDGAPPTAWRSPRLAISKNRSTWSFQASTLAPTLVTM